MKCNNVKELLVEYLDGSLSEDRRQIVEAHLRECAECRAECDSLLDSWKMLDDYSVPPVGDQFTRQVLLKVHEKSRLVAHGGLLSRLVAVFSLRNFSAVPALASLVVLAGIGYFILSGRPTGLVEVKEPPSQRVEVVRDLKDAEIIRDLEIYENAEILENLDLLVDLEAVENYEPETEK